MFAMKKLDHVGHRHVVINIPITRPFAFGYLNIYENAKGQAKPREHYHWRFIEEGCDIGKQVEEGDALQLVEDVSS